MKKGDGMKGFIFLGMAVLLVFTGCAPQTVVTSDVASLPPVSNFADDIKDITLPAELVWDRKNSMIIKTESFRGGILVYSGRAELMSLKDYMVAAMRDNKWRLVGESASENIMLAFVKPNKTCMMMISEVGLFGETELRLYVAIDKTGGVSINAFDSLPSQSGL